MTNQLFQSVSFFRDRYSDEKKGAVQDQETRNKPTAVLSMNLWDNVKMFRGGSRDLCANRSLFCESTADIEQLV